MTSSVIQNTCYLLFFTLCIDVGDGRWKKRDRDNLRHDIDLYKRMADKIEREIYAFYDEYPDETLDGDNVEVIQYKQVTNAFKNIDKDAANNGQNKLMNTTSINTNSDLTNNASFKRTDSEESRIKFNVSGNRGNSKWPKFDEILLAIGKKYDWKNDRWIKVKDKVKSVKVTSDDRKKNKANIVDYHETHKFRYKFVKLNRSKNRRSIVVAVSAIR